MTTPALDIRDLKLGFQGCYTGFTEVLHGISLWSTRASAWRWSAKRVGQVGDRADRAGALAGGARAHQRRGSFEGQELDAMLAARPPRPARQAMSMIFRIRHPRSTRCSGSAPSSTRCCAAPSPQISFDAAPERAAAILAEVSVRDAERVLNALPVPVVGGLNQRVMIAMALANEPALLIADEPGTALDVTVQAQTLHLMRKLVDEHHTAVLFISHNLGVVREFADRVYVIYKGRIVEQGRRAGCFDDPRHRLYPRPDGGGAAHHRRRHARHRGEFPGLRPAARNP
jgi:hypothetical protein